MDPNEHQAPLGKAAQATELNQKIDAVATAANQVESEQKKKQAGEKLDREKEAMLKEQRDRLDQALRNRRFSVAPVEGLIISRSAALELASDGKGHTDSAILAHALVQEGFDPFDHKNAKPYREVLEPKEEKKS